MPRELRFESCLAAPVASVWAHVSSMVGVNAELWPIQMSLPAGVRLDASTPLDRVLLRSVISVAGILPIDLHALRLVEIRDGHGFVEESTSLLERRWRHERRLDVVLGGTRVTDALTFEPRVLGGLVSHIVRGTFERRHAYLQRRFGVLAGG